MGPGLAFLCNGRMPCNIFQEHFLEKLLILKFENQISNRTFCVLFIPDLDHPIKNKRIDKERRLLIHAKITLKLR